MHWTQFRKGYEERKNTPKEGTVGVGFLQISTKNNINGARKLVLKSHQITTVLLGENSNDRTPSVTDIKEFLSALVLPILYKTSM